MQKSPNIVYVITDQQRADCLGCYGHPLLKTPNIDRLAERGVRFERFHVASPVCMPNRASIMTGRMPSGHRVRFNGVGLSLDDVTFVDVLRRGGYETALFGKSHLQNFSEAPVVLKHEAQGKTPLPHDLQSARPRHEGPEYEQERTRRWEDPEHRVRTPYYGFDHVSLATHHGDDIGGDYRRWLEGRVGDLSKVLGPENALDRPDRQGPQLWCSPLEAEHWSTHWITSEALDWIGRRKRSDAPFLMQVAYPDPHHPFVVPEPYFSMYDPAEVELPDSFDNRMPVPARNLHAALREGRAMRDKQAAFAVTEAEARSIIAVTLGMITFIDDQVGRLVEGLERAGLADDTIIVFTSDHGDFLGDYGLMLKFGIHNAGVTRVPFVWSDPRMPEAHGTVRDDLASALDFAPTVLAAAGMDCFSGAQGRDLFDPDAAEPDALLIEEENQRPILGLGQPLRMRSLVDRDWRLTLSVGNGNHELVHLADDPGETVNLWDDPAYAETQHAMMRRLTQRMIELADRTPLPTSLA